MPKNGSEIRRQSLQDLLREMSLDEADVSDFMKRASEEAPSDAGSEEAPQVSCPTPRGIKAYLDRFVIGQDRAKKALAVAVYNHVKRIGDKSGLLRKSNILMVGPSGCGKTLLAETLAELLKLPMVTVDATSLTESGYSGNCVENILTNLYLKAGEDLALAERGIVFVDEIDKLACRGLNHQREAYCRGVQQGLLKIVEGGKISAPLSLSNKNRRILIDTKNILFICGGAFAGLEYMREEEEEETVCRRIGFVRDEEEPPRAEPAPCSDIPLSPEMLVRYGLSQEFVGRLPVLIRLDPLNEEDMVRVISQTDNCLVREYRQLLKLDGVELRFHPQAIRALARIALEKKTGARGLRSVMDDLLMDLMFQAPDGWPEGKRFTVTGDMILR